MKETLSANVRGGAQGARARARRLLAVAAAGAALGAWALGRAAELEDPVPAASAPKVWSLPDALSFALTNSPDARIAEQRIRQAQAMLEQANAAAWPTLQFQSSYMRSDNPVMAFSWTLNQRSFSPALMGSLNDPDEVDNLALRGVVSVPLYAGGRIAAGRRAARAGKEAAEAGARAVREGLAFEVARAYYVILKTDAFVQAAEAGVRAYRGNVDVARKRYRTGALVKADLLDMEVRLAEAEEGLLRARNARSLAKRAFANLLGLSPREVEIAKTAPEAEAPPPGTPPRRPELEAIQKQRQAAEAAVAMAKGGYYPEVGAFGSLDHNRGWETGGEGTSWMAGVMLKWNIWDGRMTRGKVHQARAELQAVREAERKIRLAIELQIAQARLNLQDAEKRVAVSRKAVAQAEESARLTRARFAQGLALATQLIDAESALTAARMRLAEAEADRRVAVAALRRALGLPQLASLGENKANRFSKTDPS